MRPLGWVETLIKLSAFSVAYGALAMFAPEAPALSWPTGAADGARLIAAIILISGLVVGIYDRILDHELFAMLFIFANLGAHGCYIYSVLAGFPATILWIFPALMLLGDTVKITSIKLYNMRVRDIPQQILYILTGVYLLGDLVMLLPALRLL